MTSPVEKHYDHLAGAFAKWEPSPRFQRAFDLSVLAWLRERPAGELRILEAGCGHGTWIRRLLTDPAVSGRSISVFGLDLSRERLAFAQQYLQGISGVTLAAGDLLTSPMPERLDLIYAVEVFQHLGKSQQARLLQNWREALKPGGAVILLDKEFFSRHSFQVELEKLDWAPIRLLLRRRLLFPGDYLSLAATIRYPAFGFLRRQAKALGYQGSPLLRVAEFRGLILRKT